MKKPRKPVTKGEVQQPAKDIPVSIADKQYLAKILFTREKLDQKTVAKKVGVSENTMSEWVNKFNWKDLRRRLLLSKEEQLNSLYEQLEVLNEEIRNSELRRPDNGQADVVSKLTKAIGYMETDLAIADIVESGMRFIRFLQVSGTIEQVTEVTDMWHSFIQYTISTKKR